jgi:hypothetical protein
MSEKLGEIFTKKDGKIEITQFCGPDHELKVQISRDIANYIELSQMEALYLAGHLIHWLKDKIETTETKAFLDAGKITSVEYPDGYTGKGWIPQE